MKMAALVLALVLIVSVFAGCGTAKWDDIKKKDVVATVNGTEITKQHVLYQNAQDEISNKVSYELMSQLGGLDKIEAAPVEDSFKATLTRYILGELAREAGYGITEEEAYAKAYNDLILSTKKTGYDYLGDYNKQVMDMLYFDEDLMLDYASQDIYNTTPINKYVLGLMEEMQYDYPEETDPKEEQLLAAVLAKVVEDAGKVEVTLNYHNKNILKELPYERLVESAGLTFQRAA
jgi:hypothetical protein